MNYRLKYKKHYNIDFDRNYDVHHIDFNRENNNISNLLLLPKILHSKYHAYKQEFEMYCSDKIDLKLNYNSTIRRDLYLYYQEKLLDVIREIQDWITMKFLEDNGIEKYKEFRGE